MPAISLIVIGSPSRDQSYQLQFVTAANCRLKDANTIWLVERTGYEVYGVPLSTIKMEAPPGGYGWITPQARLAGWLNSMPDGSIQNLIVFSHGLRGLIALRYGWESVNLENYGLSVAEVASI